MSPGWIALLVLYTIVTLIVFIDRAIDYNVAKSTSWRYTLPRMKRLARRVLTAPLWPISGFVYIVRWVWSLFKTATGRWEEV